MDFNSEHKKALKVVKTTLTKCNSINIFHLVEVSFSTKMTRSLGNMLYSEVAGGLYKGMIIRARIGLSEILWPFINQTERRNTIIHEVCHLAAFHHHGIDIKAHGKEWKRYMELCNLPPHIYYPLEVWIKLMKSPTA